MPKKVKNLNIEVTSFLDELKHPLRKEIDQLRLEIISANAALIENIKWNGPNYTFNDIDCITMRIQPITLKRIQIIFHQGAKVKAQTKEKLIEADYKFLTWKSNDRAVATFNNMEDINNYKTDLNSIINLWLIVIEKNKN